MTWYDQRTSSGMISNAGIPFGNQAQKTDISPIYKTQCPTWTLIQFNIAMFDCLGLGSQMFFFPLYQICDLFPAYCYACMDNPATLVENDDSAVILGEVHAYHWPHISSAMVLSSGTHGGTHGLRRRDLISSSFRFLQQGRDWFQRVRMANGDHQNVGITSIFVLQGHRQKFVSSANHMQNCTYVMS